MLPRKPDTGCSAAFDAACRPIQRPSSMLYKRHQAPCRCSIKGACGCSPVSRGWATGVHHVRIPGYPRSLRETPPVCELLDVSEHIPKPALSVLKKSRRALIRLSPVFACGDIPGGSSPDTHGCAICVRSKMCSGYSSSCRATLVADSSVLPLSQHPYGRVSGIGRSARPCLRKRPLPVLHGNVDVKVGLDHILKRDQSHEGFTSLLYDTFQRELLARHCRSNGLEDMKECLVLVHGYSHRRYC